MEGEHDEGEHCECSEQRGDQVGVVDKALAFVVEVQAEEEDCEDEQRVYEDYYIGDGGVDDAADALFRLVLEERGQELGLDDFESEVEDEDEQGRREVGQEFHEAQIEELEPDEEAGAFAGFVCELLPYLFEGVGSSVYLFLFLPHELVDALDWLHLRVHVGHVHDVFVIFVDPQTQNAVLRQIHILIV